MSEKRWTPGPWVTHPDDGMPAVGIELSDGGPLLPIADVVHGHTKKGAKANAHLIAASPDLYEAVAELLREFVDPEQSLEQFDSCVVRKTVERARAALAKARGE